MVEGYMDAISLYQRGITNVVASLGTALTEAQGRLLRKYASQVIIGYDSDGAGQAATMRGMEILQNLGCDIRILQLDGEAKDPDEYVIKYGSGRLEKCVENAISLVEFKVKNLKQSMNIQTASDKIKFLNEIVKILSKVDNSIEREIYIDRIAKEYGISKEAIYAEANKRAYKEHQGIKMIQKSIKPVLKEKQNKEQKEVISRRENVLIFLLMNQELEAYKQIKEKVKPEDFKIENNVQIAKRLYEHFEKGNSNSNVLNLFPEEELMSYITSILAEDYEISNTNKAVEDILNAYEKEKLINQRNEIVKQLENPDNSEQETKELETRLNNLIIKIAKMK